MQFLISPWSNFKSSTAPGPRQSNISTKSIYDPADHNYATSSSKEVRRLSHGPLSSCNSEITVDNEPSSASSKTAFPWGWFINSLEMLKKDNPDYSVTNINNGTTPMIYSCGNCQSLYKNEVDLNKHLAMHTSKGNSHNVEKESIQNGGYEPNFETQIIPLLLVVKQLMPNLSHTEEITQVEEIYEQPDATEEDMDLELQDSIGHTKEIAQTEEIYEQPDATKENMELELEDGQGKAHQAKSSGTRGYKEHKTNLELTKKQVLQGYPCLKCGKVFKTKLSLLSHNKVHNKKKTYTCHKCENRPTFSRYIELIKHDLDVHRFKKRSEGMEEKVLCEMCGKQFGSQKKLREHKAVVHSSVKNYRCEKCGKAFSTNRVLCRHKQNHSNERPFVCDVCGKTFKRHTHLSAHMHVHSERKAFECEICGHGFYEKGNLKRHMLSHSGEKPFVCEICSKKFAHNATLKSHLAIHELDPELKLGRSVRSLRPTHLYSSHCKVCGKSFASDDDLKRHELEFHDAKKRERKFKCEHCAKSFFTKAYLKQHTEIHSNENKYVCQQCGKSFRAKIYLTQHKYVHEGRRWCCKLCGKMLKPQEASIHCRVKHYNELKTASHWKNLCELHMQGGKAPSQTNTAEKNPENHQTAKDESTVSMPVVQKSEGSPEKEKKFKCDQCGKCFGTKRDVQRHAESHNTEKKYKCPHCDKSYRTKDYLFMHKYAHDGRRWRCKLCGKMLTPAVVGKHFKIKHAAELNAASHWRDLCELHLPEKKQDLPKETAPCNVPEAIPVVFEVVEEECTVESLLTSGAFYLNIPGINFETVNVFSVNGPVCNE